MTRDAVKPLKIFMITGEPSGDLLGGRLMQALQRQTDRQIVFTGVGGPRMLAAGLQPLFPQSDLAVFGLFELLPKIYKIWQRLRQTVSVIRAARPDIVITIDSPDFVFRVGQRLRGSGIKLVHYVAPTVWAWRPQRAKQIAGFLSHLLALFPFEPPYFTREGLATTFVGHPLVESNIGGADGAAFRNRHGIAPDAKLLCVLPGSRIGEVTRLLPVFGETIARLRQTYSNLQIVLPTVPHVAPLVRAAAAEWGNTIVVEGDGEKYAAFAAAAAALCASGTVTLELALANLPMVVAYKLSPLTVLLYRRLFTITHFSLVNILLGRTAVPELLQDDCTPDRLTSALQPLLDDTPDRAAQQRDLAQIAPLLRNGTAAPSDLTAAAVLQVIRGDAG